MHETGGSVPAFLAKLWRLVEDKETNQLIHWTKDGKSFVIQNQAQFARDLLPLNYKHNNMASFIRQLNMYGFHKISSIDNGGLKFDRDEMEFSHPCFKRDSPYLLEHIKRKIATSKAVEEKTGEPGGNTVNKVLHEVKSMRGAQETFDSRLSVMKQENEALWREIASLRQKHMKQQQIVNKLIQFLVTLVQPTSRNMSGVKRQFQLMINDAPHSTGNRRSSESSENNGPVIHELTEELLEASDDPDLLTSTPNIASPGGGNYITSPVGNTFHIETIEERPTSSASYNSNYDDVNAMDDEAIQLIEQQPDQYPVKQEQSNIQTNQIVGQKQIFNNDDQSNSKRSRRRKATPEAGTSKVAKIATNGNQNKQPVFIKTENDIDQLLMMQSNTNKIQKRAGDEYITSSFLSNDVPTDIFEEQSQTQVPSTEIGGIDLASGSYNDKIDLNIGAKASSSNANKNQVAAPGGNNSLQLATVNNSNGKVVKPNEFLRLNSMEDVNTHLDGVQENLDSLKDILMGEGYSLDPNTLLGQWDSQAITKLFNDSEILNPYLSLTPSDMEPGTAPKELTYEPYCGDLSDMFNNDALAYNKTTDEQNKSPQQPPSILNTPFHE